MGQGGGDHQEYVAIVRESATTTGATTISIIATTATTTTTTTAAATATATATAPTTTTTTTTTANAATTTAKLAAAAAAICLAGALWSREELATRTIMARQGPRVGDRIIGRLLRNLFVRTTLTRTHRSAVVVVMVAKMGQKRLRHLCAYCAGLVRTMGG